MNAQIDPRSEPVSEDVTLSSFYKLSAGPIPPRRAIADDVYEAVTGLLMDGQIPAGGRVNIESIARDLQVSPTPVREAFVRLESDGLVIKRALKGYTAAPPLDAKGFEELFFMRELLEPAAAGLAAKQIDAGDLVELRNSLQTMADARSDNGNSRGFAEFKSYLFEDAAFHHRIAQASGNELLADGVVRLRSHMHLYRLFFEREIITETHQEHEVILDALVAGNSDEAAAAMRDHIVQSRTRIASQFASIS